MLSFTAEDHARVADGEITVTWRLWKYAHVKAGRPYSTGFGFVQIDDVRLVRVADVTDADAKEAGLRNAPSLVDLARSHTGASVSPETLLYRVQFHYLGEARPDVPFDLGQAAAHLGRLDRLSRRGPWTLATLRLIESNPGVVARLLAREFDWDTADLKVRVRKLKALGLTVSLDIGYELSEFGQAYLDSVEWDKD